MLTRIVLLWGALATAIAAGTAGAATVLPTGFTDALVTAGLSQPVGMAWLPDGRLLVIEQKTANVRLVVQDTLVATPLFTVPEVNGVGLERGLLGIAVDPEFPTRPFIYVYLSHAGVPPTNHLVRYTLTGELANGASTDLGVDPLSGFAILTDLPDNADNHNGGSIRFGPDGLLYVSLGDDAGGCVAQDPSNLRGALLRLDVSGLPLTGTDPVVKSALVPAGNPLTGPDDNARLTVAFGLRNPFRIHVDPVTARVFIGDVGQSAYEEVSLLEPDGLGKNFGWPMFEGIAGTGAVCPGAGTDLTAPIAFYDRTAFGGPAAVISAGVYRGHAFPTDRSFPPEYEGSYFFAEYYQGFLRRVQRNDDGTWTSPAPVPGQPSAIDWAQGLSTPADFGVGPDGALYYLSQFGGGGSLHRIAFAPGFSLQADDAHGTPGDTGVAVAVRTSAPITVGSTDVRLRFDPAALEATGVTSTLESFTFAVDNAAGAVTTASASAEGQLVPADAPLFTVAFTVRAGASGCTPLTVEDADGVLPDDLAGPVPPIPPSSIMYGTTPGAFCASTCGNGVLEPGEECEAEPGNPCCTPTCEFADTSTSCPDGPCTVGRTCDGGGSCGGGVPRVCDDGDPCTADRCVPGTGCTTEPASDGTPCADDGNACTADRCAAGVCTHPNGVDCANLGDVDCDGRGATPIDAEVIACLVAGRCQDADVPSPCDDASVRRSRADWNASGALDLLDTGATLEIFVGRRAVGDTPLGTCCPALAR